MIQKNVKKGFDSLCVCFVYIWNSIFDLIMRVKRYIYVCESLCVRKVKILYLFFLHNNLEILFVMLICDDVPPYILPGLNDGVKRFFVNFVRWYLKLLWDACWLAEKGSSFKILRRERETHKNRIVFPSKIVR